MMFIAKTPYSSCKFLLLAKTEYASEKSYAVGKSIGRRHTPGTGVRCQKLARNGHAEVSWRCPLLGEQRKTFARIELFDPKRTSASVLAAREPAKSQNVIVSKRSSSLVRENAHDVETIHRVAWRRGDGRPDFGASAKPGQGLHRRNPQCRRARDSDQSLRCRACAWPNPTRLYARPKFEIRESRGGNERRSSSESP